MDWPTFWSATASLTSCGLLAVTGIYAWLTHRMAKAAERQSWELARPRLNVSLRTNQGGQFFLLHIENVGQTAADNLTLRLDRPVHQTFGQKQSLSRAPAFDGVLRSLPPRVPLRFGLGVYFTFFAEDTDRSKHPLSFAVIAQYESSGVTFNEQFPIDMWEQEFLTHLDRDHLDAFGRDFPQKFESAARDITRALDDIAQPAPVTARRRSWAPWFQKAHDELGSNFPIK